MKRGSDHRGARGPTRRALEILRGDTGHDVLGDANAPPTAADAQRTEVPVLAFIGHHDTDLVPHFLSHYRGLGAGSFHLVLHGSWAARKLETLRREPDVHIDSLESEIFSEVLKRRRLNELAQNFKDRWILTTDADELLQLPLASLAQTIRWLERLGANALQAVTVQRLAEDGELLAIDEQADLDATFPRFNVHLAEDMGLAAPIWKHQFPLAYVGSEFAISRGSHFPPNPEIALHVPLRGAVHHFKWRAPLRESLKSPRGEGANASEQEVYSEWLQDNGGRLPLANSRRCTTEALRERGLLVVPSRSQLRSAARRQRGRGHRARGRIALVSFEITGPDRSGGVGTAIGALAEALTSDGHDVHVLYCPYNGPEELWPGWAEYWEARGVRLHYLPRRIEKGLWPSFEQFSKKVSGHLETIGAHVLHFVDADAYGAAAAVERHLGRAHASSRIITSMHGSMTWHRRGNLLESNAEEEANLKGLKLLLQSTDVACYPSEYMRGWIHEHLRVSPSNELVIPNCLPGTSRSFKTVQSAPKPVHEIVLFGRLEWRKGLRRFADAIRRLEDTAQETQITLLGRLGDDSSREEIEDLLGPSHLRPRLLTNYDSFDAIHYLKARDCVAVVPSTLDNSPYTVFECLEAGVPLITSSVGGIPELVDSRDHAHVLRADDGATLAHALSDAVAQGLAPGRLAFDPELVEQAHLELHSREVERANSPRSVTVQIDDPAAQIFLRSSRPPSLPARVLARAVAAGRSLRGTVGERPRSTMAPYLSEPPTTTGSTAVLMYHAISDQGSPQTAAWRVSPRRFEQQLAWLRDTDHRSLRLADLARLLRGEPLEAERTVLLTFDDGYQDFYEYALPLLQKYDFGALVFVVTSRVGATSNWDRALSNEVPLMGWEQLGEIARHGFEIGSHAHDHLHLAELSEVDQLEQLGKSQQLLEAQLGQPAKAIAYPFGSHDDSVRNAARHTGHELGFGTAPGRATARSAALAIERFTVTESWTPSRMASLLGGEEET